MSSYNVSFEIHIHGQVPLRSDVGSDQLHEALRPVWQYSGAKSFVDGATSKHEDEPGIRFDPASHLLQICWTVMGDGDFRQVLDEMCMNLNDLAAAGAAIEVTFYDADFDDDETARDGVANDDFVMLFVGPNPAAIMQVQRDLLVQEVVAVMERHFESAELGEVVEAVDRLFTKRFDALVSSLEIGKLPPGSGGTHAAGRGGRKSKHSR